MADERRSAAVYLATLAESSERYDDMVEAMKSVASMNSVLTEKERDLLVIGYRNKFKARCTALRALASIERDELNNGNHENMKQVKDYAEKVEEELTQIRKDLVSLLRLHVIPYSSTSVLDHVLYNKMIGDSYRFCAEFKTGHDQHNLGNHALNAYLIATDKVENLPPTNKARLSLGYGLSLLFCDVFKNIETALEIAKDYYDAAETAADVNMERTKESLQLSTLLHALIMRCNNALISKEGHRTMESDDP